MGDDPSKTILCGGSAGAFLCAQVAYRLMSEGDHTTITGCVLLFAVALHWEYDGKYKHMYTAWDENGNAGTPVFGLELAKFIWCKYSASDRTWAGANSGQHITMSTSAVHATSRFLQTIFRSFLHPISSRQRKIASGMMESSWITDYGRAE